MFGIALTSVTSWPLAVPMAQDEGSCKRDHAKSSTDPTTINPTESPIHNPVTPYPKLKQRRYPTANPRASVP